MSAPFDWEGLVLKVVRSYGTRTLGMTGYYLRRRIEAAFVPVKQHKTLEALAADKDLRIVEATARAEAAERIAAHTKALIDGAGERHNLITATRAKLDEEGRQLPRWAWQGFEALYATIAALTAENERLAERKAPYATKADSDGDDGA